MDVLQQTVYRSAAQNLENHIKKQKETTQYWQFLDANYPNTFQNGEVHEDEMTQLEVRRDMMQAEDRLQKLKRKRRCVGDEVEFLVNKIYRLMSDVRMTFNKINNIAQVIHNFMTLTGNQWIEYTEFTQWKAYLIGEWNRSMVPYCREDVWIMIPAIAHTFVRKLNYAEAVGRVLPDLYPDYVCKLKYEYLGNGDYGKLIEP